MMYVKDLIHLLQTRAKPDDRIRFQSFVSLKDHHILQVGGEAPTGFNSVYREDEGNDDFICYIDIGETFINNLFVSLDEIDIKKATHGSFDAEIKMIKQNNKSSI